MKEQHVSGAIESSYSVRGMKCGGCVAKATAVLSRLPGYVTAEFDLRAGTAVVRGGVDPQAVVKALNSLGYPAAAEDS